MGSQKVQGELWGKRSSDWASIQEVTANPGYEYTLKNLNIKSGNTLLDIGCGTGLFCHLAFERGAKVTGIDASSPQIEEAQKRNGSIRFLSGEMEELPFEDNSFDIVCGFNSFQFAASVKNALTDAKRVLKIKGKLVVMIWGNKEDCEAATYFKAVGSLLPPQPQGAPGPFALSENRLLENMLEEIGFKILNTNDVQSIWDYQDSDIALRGLLSTGPAALAIEGKGYDKVSEAIAAAIKPYTNQNGRVIYKNTFRIIIAEKQN